jgi:O-antigen/teichoic acid export membrane protein
VPAVLFIIPTFFGAYLFADEILRYVFSPEYTNASSALVILVGSQVFQAFYMMFGRALRALDYIEQSVKIEVVAIIINVTLNITLIPLFGLIGAAVATTTAILFNSVAHYLYLSQLVPVKIPYRQLGIIISASIIMFVALTILERYVVVNSFITLFMMILAGVGVYFIVILIDSSTRTKVEKNIRNVLQ